MEGSPLLIVFAGPNGSGKSTLAEEMRARDPAFPPLYINADDIARARDSSGSGAGNRGAVRARRSRPGRRPSAAALAEVSAIETGGRPRLYWRSTR